MDPESIKAHTYFKELEYFCFADESIEPNLTKIKIEPIFKKERSKTPVKSKSRNKVKEENSIKG